MITTILAMALDFLVLPLVLFFAGWWAAKGKRVWAAIAMCLYIGLHFVYPLLYPVTVLHSYGWLR